MRKILVAAALALFATSASAAIKNSSHDLSSNSTTSLGSNGTGGASCAYCHMPHNGSTLVGAPLWARNISYTQTYTLYASTQAGHAVPVQPNAGSRVCLSCHDGTQSVAVVYSAYGSAYGTQALAAGTATLSASRANIGTSLADDHPVSVTYNSAAGNPGGLGAAPEPFLTSITTLGTVECITCHNAHTQAGAASSYTARQFMVSYTGDFCGSCHSLK